ncbi:MAG TPA: chemotaxis-specific protein-glutamate methyltransferase CheB [Sandaracinaceae bacterium LLY-WYZ-13_1]|nr:chemotaxis-specific protein-glutamate methyltransferase CheB [Sandaracinaceae bacterium LLY-WYZ-13_1]
MALKPLRVLVVDDSAFNRKLIGEILESIEGVTVVGKASDGEEALRLLGALEPDLITLDLEMPRMDGFSFLRFVMARRPTPVIVISSHSAKQNVFRALELGALDFVAKPSASPGERLNVIRDELVAKVGLVRSLERTSLDRSPRSTVSSLLRRVRKDDERPLPIRDTPRHVLVVGASTGGPSALVDMFSWIQSDTEAAALVVQHMPVRFTRTFAERLDRLGGLRVTEAADGDRLRAGRALVCPGGRCVEVERVDEGYAVRVRPPDPADRYVPSVDRALTSAAAVAGRRVIAVVLTGMGDDGAEGVQAVKRRGGQVLVQSPDDAIIDGMPRSALRTGAVDQALPLQLLRDRVARMLSEP